MSNGKRIIKDNIPGYPGYYITESGRLFSKHRYNKWIEKKTYLHRNGYLKVSLNRDKLSIHRLVAMVYLDKPKGKNIVCHKDNDKLNNHKDNLYWGTQKENLEQMVRENRQYKGPKKKGINRGEKNGNSKLSDLERDYIIGLHKMGLTAKEISKKVKTIKYVGIRRVIKNYNNG